MAIYVPESADILEKQPTFLFSILYKISQIKILFDVG
jgi:hypothetical protein